MFFTIRIYIYATLLVIGSLLKLNRAKRLFNEGNKGKNAEGIFETPKTVSKKVLERTGSKVEVTGQKNLPKGAVLFVANHQGLFDILVLLGYLGKPVGFIAKKEIKRLPIINKWMELIYCVFMDRKDRRQSVRAIHEGIHHLKDGHSIVVFPEGTRSRGENLNSFKSGSLNLATRANVPIVPVAIDGTYQMLEEDNGRVKASTIKLTIEKPIYPKDYAHMKNGELAISLKETIEHRLKENRVTQTGETQKPVNPEPIGS